jgi:uncharacterized protein YecE (DUF72 family)
MNRKKLQVWLGTSGYSYADWVGGFYPAGTQPRQMLGHYCRHFPLVELNFTFYRAPTPASLATFASRTPAGFQFLVKLPRTLSHERDPQGFAPFRQAVAALQERDRLAGVLCQLPQASHNDREQKDWLDRLAHELADCRPAVEFRHRSWYRPDIPAWLAERGLDLVAVDVPALPGLYPSGLVQSGSRIYVRFHSRNADNWYRSDKERYDYNYSDEELAEWIRALANAPAESEQALLLFNNCQRGHSAVNAQRMQELLGRLAPELTVVELPCPAPTQPRQRSLFDDGEPLPGKSSL